VPSSSNYLKNSVFRPKVIATLQFSAIVKVGTDSLFVIKTTPFISFMDLQPLMKHRSRILLFVLMIAMRGEKNSTQIIADSADGC